jgi:hypothetical protein
MDTAEGIPIGETYDITATAFDITHSPAFRESGLAYAARIVGSFPDDYT